MDAVLGRTQLVARAALGHSLAHRRWRRTLEGVADRTHMHSAVSLPAPSMTALRITGGDESTAQSLLRSSVDGTK